LRVSLGYYGDGENRAVVLSKGGVRADGIVVVEVGVFAVEAEDLFEGGGGVQSLFLLLRGIHYYIKRGKGLK
jgi:hypothetical protein